MLPFDNYLNKSKVYQQGEISGNNYPNRGQNYHGTMYGRNSPYTDNAAWQNRQNYEYRSNYYQYGPHGQVDRVPIRTYKAHNTYNQNVYDHHTPAKQTINKFNKSTVAGMRSQNYQIATRADLSGTSKNKYQAKSSKNIPLYERLKNVEYPVDPVRKNDNFLHSTYEHAHNRHNHDTSLRKTTQDMQYGKSPQFGRDKMEKSRSKIDLRPKSNVGKPKFTESAVSREYIKNPAPPIIHSRSTKKIVSYNPNKISHDYDYEQQEDDLRTTPGFGRINQKNQLKKSREVQKEPKLQDFMLGECKGEGRFGKVYLAVHKKSGFVCALKKIKKESVKFMIEQFIQELKIQQFLNHPNLVKIYGYFADKQYFYMLVEYMEEGSLYSLMKKSGKKLTEQETAKKMHEICSGIKFMHELNIVHRDMKPQNIVLTHDVCKVCDFGWATVCEDRRNTYCGTLDYVCPQIADGKDYDSSVDIWCLGVLAYQMMCGKAPFYNISRKKTIENIKECKMQNFPSHLSRQAVSFISMILQKDPQQRVDIQELLNSQFLRNIQV